MSEKAKMQALAVGLVVIPALGGIAFLIAILLGLHYGPPWPRHGG
jgi:hypothetical protein